MTKDEPGGEPESPTEIATHIISILSQSAYTSFAQALREIIVNAYDAMADRVDVRFSDDLSRLSIADDGLGMTQEDFQTRYARIATPSGTDRIAKRGNVKRLKVGKFGIGHLAIAPVCRRARIVTSKGKGHPTLEFTLDYSEYLDHANLAKPLSEVYQYYVEELPERAIRQRSWANASATTGARAEGFTVVELEDIHPEIIKQVKKKGLTLTDTFVTTKDLSGIAKLKWELGAILPVRYAKDSPVQEPPSIIAKIVADVKAASFKVFVDDDEVIKPIRLPAFSERQHEKAKLGANYDVDAFSEDLLNTGAKIRGYIVSQSSQVMPSELRGLLVRLRGVAIGLYRPDFLGAKVVSAVFRDSTSGEIYLEEGFDDTITLDRTNFKDSPVVGQLRLWLEARLSRLRTQYWAAGRKRQQKRAQSKAQSFDEKIGEKVAGILSGPKAPREFHVTPKRPANNKPCEVKTTTGEIRIDRKHKLFKGLKAKEKEILEICLYALEIARERGGPSAEPFYLDTLKVITELLDRGSSS